jgi:hypothetical protein
LSRPLNSFGESPQVEAQFSLPYGIALAIARRHVFIEDFFEEKIRGDTGVLQLAKPVSRNCVEKCT